LTTPPPRGPRGVAQEKPHKQFPYRRGCAPMRAGKDVGTALGAPTEHTVGPLNGRTVARGSPTPQHPPPPHTHTHTPCRYRSRKTPPRHSRPAAAAAHQCSTAFQCVLPHACNHATWCTAAEACPASQPHKYTLLYTQALPVSPSGCRVGGGVGRIARHRSVLAVACTRASTRGGTSVCVGALEGTTGIRTRGRCMGGLLARGSGLRGAGGRQGQRYVK
jgi:hypothetical protein